MAKGLGRSIRRNSPGTALAVVTNAPEEHFSEFDEVIALNEDHGSGLCQTLFLDKYSPFEETLYVDSDCLSYNRTDKVWSKFEQCNGFVVEAHEMRKRNHAWSSAEKAKKARNKKIAPF